MHAPRWNSLTLLTSVLLVITLLLSGCSWGTKKQIDDLPLMNDEAHTIKIMYDYDELQFYNQYGTLFVSKYPNINLEVINMQFIEGSGELTDEAIYSFIEKEKPDILLLSMEQYETLANEGNLYDLEQLVSQNNFDLNGIHPAIIKLIQERSFGKLFGLTPTFDSKALLYNVDLFQAYGIEPPTDSMSWEEVIALAKRFPTDGNEQDRVYGFSLPMYSTYADLAYSIGLTNGLRMLTEDDSQISLHTDSWKQAFQTIVDADSSDAVLLPSAQDSLYIMQNYYNNDPFISGKLAMKLVNPYEVQMFTEAKQVVGEENLPRWNIVSAPVQPNNRNQSNDFSIQQVYAIHADSENVDAAWEFVQYIHSPEFARIHAKLPYSHLLQSQTAFIPDVFDVSMEPFYKLEPGNHIDPLEGTPLAFKHTLLPIIEDELQDVINNIKTVEDAIIEMETRAQEALIQASIEVSTNTH